MIYPYVLDLGSTSIGPKEPIPMAARFLNLAKKSAVFFKVSCGVVVGNCSSSTVLNSSSATAQINFVPPASKLPYKFVIGLKLPWLFFIIVSYFYLKKEDESCNRIRLLEKLYM